MATRARRGPPLTQEEIVEAALAIADAEGLEAISMRKLAASLGVGAMTLYHHVKDKQELLLLMSDAVSGELLVQGEFPTNWRDALRTIAHNTRAAHERHPWLLESVTHRPGPTMNSLRHVEQSIAAVADLDVDAATARAMIFATDDYTVGFVLRNAAIAEMQRRGGFAPDASGFGDMLATGEFPRLAAAVEEMGGSIVSPVSHFDQGLEWLFDGMQARIDAGD